MTDETGSSPKSLTLSLSDILGTDYMEAACAAHAFLDGGGLAESKALANEKVDF